MLGPERHQLILSMLQDKSVLHIQEIIDTTGASESTIRRDLSELEEKKLLKRVHGGCTHFHNKIEEPTVTEKTAVYDAEKRAIGRHAASLVKTKDCIFIDAGTTTLHMIPFLAGKDIIAVTNGLNTATELLSVQVRTILLGGDLKAPTLSLVGRGAVISIQQYRFDKCFLGMNGVHEHMGFTTPDPGEAYIKQLAVSLSDEKYVLCDSSKLSQVTFAKVADLQDCTIITDNGADEVKQAYSKKTKMITVIA
ncbi:DeoR/GlpR family DNA-binding transcription regulator [Aneurinibacillus sp. Ricciae_BoGa-3]|uniref:DeoR/GlpR family DNA-binding transcription regulator n=1 Tax=Aneurinibacillus sp. Ricciae_BoGa-3 TaxID=3022697 RepID=UPI002342700C|nr:DeoR/GlpR family DNA-binding transcription regulator [Aneurinibacillus sp. Ricciae_BoGa-3]WCK56730.1 DeoR/GlpR family DNA-binding transcription regulator [Aneurinibacillus sp. Ricciae_BoGa-3]